MKRYYVVQFLVEEKNAWEVMRDLQVIFGKHINSVQLIPHTESADSPETYVAEPEVDKPKRKYWDRKSKVPRGSPGTRGGRLRGIITDMIREHGPQARLPLYQEAMKRGMSGGNVQATLNRMEKDGEIVQSRVRGVKIWDLVTNTDVIKQGENSGS